MGNWGYILVIRGQVDITEKLFFKVPTLCMRTNAFKNPTLSSINTSTSKNEKDRTPKNSNYKPQCKCKLS